MPQTPQSSFRLPSPTLEQIDRIGRAQGGLTRTRVIELAVATLHNRLFPSERAQPPRPRTERTRP